MRRAPSDIFGRYFFLDLLLVDLLLDFPFDFAFLFLAGICTTNGVVAMLFKNVPNFPTWT
jgi:hypothetical protein